MNKLSLFFVCLLFLLRITPSWSESVSSLNNCEVLVEEEMIKQSYDETKTGWKEWEYSEIVKNIDLNHDRKPESILIKAKVSKDLNGKELLWDDGQPWVVIIRERTGKETIVFLQWVQLSQISVQVLSVKNKNKILRLNIPQPVEYDSEGKGHKILIRYDIFYSKPNHFSVCKKTIRKY